MKRYEASEITEEALRELSEARLEDWKNAETVGEIFKIICYQKAFDHYIINHENNGDFANNFAKKMAEIADLDIWLGNPCGEDFESYFDD